jgi:hypothetical protein
MIIGARKTRYITCKSPSGAKKAGHPNGVLAKTVE